MLHLLNNTRSLNINGHCAHAQLTKGFAIIHLSFTFLMLVQTIQNQMYAFTDKYHAELWFVITMRFEQADLFYILCK